MGIFFKKEKRTLLLSYRFIQDGRLQVIEAYGEIDGHMKYLNAFYCVNKEKEPWFLKLIEDLIRHEGEKIEITGFFKRETIKDFRINLNDMSDIIKNKDLTKLELTGWGITDKPYEFEF